MKKTRKNYLLSKSKIWSSKFLTLLLLSFFISCDNDASSELEEQEITATEVEDFSGTLKTSMLKRYTLDGEVITDQKLIKESLESAYSKHFNFKTKTIELNSTEDVFFNSLEKSAFSRKAIEDLRAKREVARNSMPIPFDPNKYADASRMKNRHKNQPSAKIDGVLLNDYLDVDFNHPTKDIHFVFEDDHQTNDNYSNIYYFQDHGTSDTYINMPGGYYYVSNSSPTPNGDYTWPIGVFMYWELNQNLYPNYDIKFTAVVPNTTPSGDGVQLIFWKNLAWDGPITITTLDPSYRVELTASQLQIQGQQAQSYWVYAQ